MSSSLEFHNMSFLSLNFLINMSMHFTKNWYIKYVTGYESAGWITLGIT